jgi:putative membrane protein
MLPNFVIRLFVNAVALAGVAWLLPGIHIRDNAIGTVLLVALIFGVVNALLKPIILVMSCPLILVTFGLFALVVNGLMLLITDELAGGRFEVDGIGWAILGGLVIGVIAGILEGALKDERSDKRNVTVQMRD